MTATTETPAAASNVQELVFEDGETTATRATAAADKPNRFLTIVREMPVQEPAKGKTYKDKRVVLPLAGELVFVGAAKDKDGNPLADEDREQQDTAVVAVRRELDAAGTAAGVTVRKKFELLSLDKNGQPNNRKDAKKTHFRVVFWTTPKQARKRAAEETPVAETPVSE